MLNKFRKFDIEIFVWCV